MSEVRIPPHSLEAERVVLSAIMLDHFSQSELLCIVKQDWFYDLNHVELFGLIQRMNELREPIEPPSVAVFAASRNKLESIGGPETLFSICEATSSTPKHYAKILERHWLQRKLIGLGRQLLESAFSGEQEPADILSGLADEIIQLQASKTSHAVKLSESLAETLTGIEARAEKAVGISTGFRDVDDMLGGLRPGQLVILAARPAVGKSALALEVSRHVAATSGGGVLFASLEMGHTEQTERLLSAGSGVSGRAMLTGKLSDIDQHAIGAAAERLAPLPLYYVDQLFDIDSIVSAAKNLHAKGRLSLLVCDYLQLCEASGVPENQRERAVAKLSRSFKRLAMQLQIPVLALSQLNRDVEKRTDKRPVLSDLRESGAIEQDANVVMFLHRPEMYDSEHQPGLAELIVGKNRNGATGIVTLKFRKELTRFENYSQYDEYENF